MRRIDRVVAAVAAVAVAGMLARFVRLGARPFHWEEARVGYWTLRYADTGSYAYRPVGGGPLLYHLNETLFAVLPATDASARAAVALLGGGLALAALLFRSRLRDDETVALALVLGFAPLLLYYSRFLRGDLPVATFALITVGLTVRAVDADDARFLYAAGVAAGLAVATSMQALGYLAAFAAAFVFAVDHRRVRDAEALSERRVAAVRSFADRWLGPVAGSALAFAATLFVAYVPRGSDLGPFALFEAALVDPFDAATGVYVAGREGTQFLDAVTFATESLTLQGFPVLVAAAIGFFAQRYGIRADDGDGRSGFLIRWAGLAAGFGVLVFSLGNEVLASWVLVHVTVVLSIPAAVGIALLFRSARNALAADDAARLAAVLLVLLALAVPTAALAADAYATPGDPALDDEEYHDRFAHFAQPADDLEPLVGDIADAIGGTNDGGPGAGSPEVGSPDAVYVGDQFAVADERAFDAPPLSQEEAATFGERLPLPWYLERAGAQSESVASPDGLAQYVGDDADDDPPAVVLTTPEHRNAVAERLDGYQERSYRTALEDREVVVFLRG
ncbi:TIGR03663 family protein [Halalkaliarchaeum sp. AArc-GB]|uniref:flippase activity-associated protein Agl23 n=1 Tax=Halalkaliarchaeum sp. AArc-GB TaxID=3074078 RepID=UPI00286328B1|nr:flippase activity-associated protein Agl23 [Halalkaliarchaeum sp. AArc-GB]MDR5674076.1 TIGR03663 family protein [Halalkaliarchaeum sp. AArc-GB]